MLLCKVELKKRSRTSQNIVILSLIAMSFIEIPKNRIIHSKSPSVSHPKLHEKNGLM